MSPLPPSFYRERKNPKKESKEASTCSNSRIDGANSRIDGANSRIYVAGCFPVELMNRASNAHPGGLHMLMLIKRAVDRRRVRGKGRERPVVAVTDDLCCGWGVSRHTRRRIIAALEAAGLLVVEERRCGAAPLVRFASGVKFPRYARPEPLPKLARIDVFDPSQSEELSK